MKYPSWAPSALVSQVPIFEKDARSEVTNPGAVHDDGLSAKEALDLLYRLISDTRMESIWNRLERRAHSHRPDPRKLVCEELEEWNNNRHFSLALLFNCLEAIGQWRLKPKLTRAEERDIHLAIAKRAEQLFELLQTESGSPHVQWSFYPEELADFGKRFALRTLDGNAGTYFDGPRGLPPFDRFLKRMKENALEFAANPSAVAQPNATDAHIRYAALQLSDHFVHCYNQPLHSIVADLTNVILGADITEDHVRAWVRTATRKKPDQIGR